MLSFLLNSIDPFGFFRTATSYHYMAQDEMSYHDIISIVCGAKVTANAATSSAIRCGRWWSTGGPGCRPQAWSKFAVCPSEWIRIPDDGRRAPNWGVRCGR